MKKLQWQELISKSWIGIMDCKGVKRNCYIQEKIGGLFASFRFLTIIPLSFWAEKDNQNFKYGLIWFPFIGLFIGCCTAGLVKGLSFFLPYQFCCVAGLFLLAGVSGFLHLDGVADTADGFFSSRPKEQILEIMKDSRIGPMGVIILLFLLVTKYSVLSSLSLPMMLSALVLMPISGRCAIMFQMSILDYAREKNGGLGALFNSSSLKRKTFTAFLFLMFISVWLVGSYGFILLAGCVLGNFWFAILCRRKIGGYTGDTLGSSCELTEMLTAVCLSVIV